MSCHVDAFMCGWRFYRNKYTPGQLILVDPNFERKFMSYVNDDPWTPWRDEQQRRGLEPTWTTADGRTLKLKDMPIGHLMNVYKFLGRMRHTSEKRLDLRKLLEVRDEIHRRGRRIPPAYVPLSGGNDALRKLVDELLEEQAQLAVEMQGYKIDSERLRKENATLRERVTDRNRRVDELTTALNTQLRRVRELEESALVVKHGIFPPRESVSLAVLAIRDGDRVRCSRDCGDIYRVTVQRNGASYETTGASPASFADAAEVVVKHEAEQARERAARTLAARAFEDKKQSLLERNAERTRLRLDIANGTITTAVLRRALLFLLKQPVRE